MSRTYDWGKIIECGDLCFRAPSGDPQRTDQVDQVVVAG